jgi:ABC-2 type transport system permease protein
MAQSSDRPPVQWPGYPVQSPPGPPPPAGFGQRPQNGPGNGQSNGQSAGVIHDIGFRHYEGPRLGRGYLLRSLYVESLKGCYGLGRSAKSKVMPFILLAVMTLPALIIAIVAGVTNASKLPLQYTEYMIVLQTAISVFLASQSPASVSRDLRFKVMPLYFSRPLTRNDYVLAKFGAMTTALFILISGPLTVLYAGALLGKLPFWAQTRGYLSALVGAALLALVLAGIGLLIASITPRRGFGVAAVITVLLLLSLISSVLATLADQQDDTTFAGYLGLVDPVALVDGVMVWLFNTDSSFVDPPPGTVGGIIFALTTVAVVAGCYGLLIARYRKVSAS